jgi:hypothetical protein
MKKLLPAIALLCISLNFLSCKKETVSAPVEETSTDLQVEPNLIIGGGEETACAPTVVSLLAGQTIAAGTVSVTNDAQYIYVTYTAANGYYLKQTHLYVGNCAAIPVNNPGNPIPGQFPYNSTHNNISTYTYQVPIAAIAAGSCGCIAAHSVVVKLNASGQVIEQQTGWGNGTQINSGSGNWGMKFDYCSCSL